MAPVASLLWFDTGGGRRQHDATTHVFKNIPNLPEVEFRDLVASRHHIMRAKPRADAQSAKWRVRREGFSRAIDYRGFGRATLLKQNAKSTPMSLYRFSACETKADTPSGPCL